MTRPTYHIVSHSHWDREWYKSFEQFRAMLVNMVDDLLELLKSSPEFRYFTLDGQTVILEDYLAVRPEQEETLRQLVKEGRLLIGPWYILPDEFLVSAEATVRNLLVGRQIARQFGREMQLGYIPDSFGHIAMIPTIVQGFGIDTALIYRGFGGEPGQNFSEYWWHAPDGTKVLMLHLFRDGYSTGYFHHETEEQILPRFRKIKKELDERAVTSHRLMMNGGDHHWPDPKLPQTLDLLRKHFDGEFVHSTLPQYVEAVKREIDQLHSVYGEHRFGYRYAFVVNGGVYSSRMYLKQQNWKNQMLLQRYAEPLDAFAVSMGKHSQYPLIRQAWRTLMQNHPHDSICGCSIDSVHQEMLTRFKAVEDLGQSTIDDCLNGIIPYDEREWKDDRTLFFFNPSPVPRDDVGEAVIGFHLQDVVVGMNPDVQVAPKVGRVQGFLLRDAVGEEVPFQLLSRREGFDISYSHYDYPKQTSADLFSVLVDARAVPGVGFKGLRIERTPAWPRYKSSLRVGRTFMENDDIRLDVNTRGVVTLRDKRSGRRFTGLHVFEDGGDVGDEYNYSYPRKDTVLRSDHTAARIRFIERGPLRATIEIRQNFRVPAAAAPDRKKRGTRKVELPITTRLSITARSRLVSFETVVDNVAKDHRFRVLFRSGIKTDTAYADSQFTVVSRQQKKYRLKDFTIEHPASVGPMQRFVAVRDREKAFVLFSHGMPEYELFLDGAGTLALTLLRCVGRLAGDDLITRPGGKAGWDNDTPDAQCQGVHTFRYAIAAISGEEFDDCRAVTDLSEQFHLPLLPVRRKNKEEMDLEGSFVALTGNLTLSAVKQAEDGDGVVLRAYNPTSRAVTDTIRFGKPVRQAWLSRMDEERIADIVVTNAHDIAVQVPPYGVITVKAILSSRHSSI